MLTGCEDDWGAYANPDFETENIGFAATMNEVTSNATTRYDGYVSIGEEEWVIEGQPAQTRGAVATTLTGQAGLTGFVYDGAWIDTNTPLAHNKEYNFGSLNLNNEYDLTAVTPVSWDNENIKTRENLRVFAYAPYVAITGKDSSGDDLAGGTGRSEGITCFSAANATGVPTLTYKVPDNIEDQTDLLAATNIVAGNYKKSIPLTFNHALTAIHFKVDFACTIKELELRNVYNTGTYKIGGTSSLDWTGQTIKQTYTIVSSNVHKSKGDLVTAEGNPLILLPQTLPDDAEVYIKFTDDTDSKDYIITAPIKGNVWQSGKRITYTIAKSPSYSVYLDLALGDITITPTSYSGKININTGGSMSTMTISKSGLTTEQIKALKFYVFQSNNASSTSPGYHKGYTGGLDVNADGSFAPADGSVLELPNYPEVTCNGKSWSEYITNNPNSKDVIDNWNLDSGSGSNKGAAAGRTQTSYKIYIYHPTVNDDKTLSVDLTIDNLWSNAMYAHDSFDQAYGGITVGTHVLSTAGSSGMPDTWTDKMDVTLRLKGDNRFKAVNFSTPNTADKFYITSADGDNSTKGSLTVMPSTSSEWVEDGGLTSMRFRSERAIYAVYYHHGFKIKGGTIYTATSVSAQNREYSFFPCLGAGRNSCIEMEISGGSVTSVAHGTSAAIGAGGGFNGSGGNADIRISGGKVYAYHFGVDYYSTSNSSNRYKNINHPLTSTAIGGGSTFQQIANSAVVRIYGDAEVYAQSVGGVAIGGGSSCGGPGGNGEVHISGNAKVTAKSISGSITNSTIDALSEDIKCNYTVPAGTSIGGGKAGWYDLSYEEGTMVQNGGNAVVSISEMSKTLAGSIGGGDAGVLEGGYPGKIGSASVELTSAEVQAQFIMQAGSDIPPTFTMNSGTLFRNSDPTFEFVKEEGGAVYIGEGTNPGTFTMNGGTIRNFIATKGGAVYLEDGEVHINGGTIDNCSATQGGGAIYVQGGEVNMTGGTIQNCTSTQEGGGIYVTGGDVEISNASVSISRNSSAVSGGGVFVNNGDFTMSSGNIVDNYAAVNGGGVFVSSENALSLDPLDPGVTVTISGGNITGNTSGNAGGGVSVVPGSNKKATVVLGVANQGDTNPDISGNGAIKKGGGVYASGSLANITINSGKIIDNNVSALVANNDVANDGGMVTLNAGNVTHVVVTYHKNDGVTPETTSSQNIVTNVRSILSGPSTTWSVAGKTLSGWATSANGEVYKHTGDEVTLSSGLHLYAVWANN